VTGLSPQLLAELVAELGPGSPLDGGRRPPVSPPDNTPAQDLGRRDGSRALSPRAELVHLSGTEPRPPEPAAAHGASPPLYRQWARSQTTSTAV